MMDKETLDALAAAKRQAKLYTADRPDVVGVGIGDKKVRIYLKDDEGRLGIPESFGGFPVEFVVTGEIKAYAGGVKNPLHPEKCYGCDQIKIYSGEFCDDCLETWKEEGPEVVY
jgi:hypothetical protein